MKKSLYLLVLVVLLISVAFDVSAGTSIGGTSGGSGTSVKIPEFLFIPMHDGIGCGRCPVYTAPTMEAYRCNDGKAECNTNYDMYIGGFNNEGWLMVRYGTNNGATRVGYIPPKYVKNFKHWKKLDFSYVKTIAQSKINVTDNPMSNYSAFAYLDPGETYYILGDYNYYGDWWYIECMVDGMIARGFIEKFIEK